MAALERIAELLERMRDPTFLVRAFSQAAASVKALSPSELAALAEAGGLKTLAGVGEKTERVVLQALAGEVPSYLSRLEGNLPVSGSGPAADLRALLRGDCHTHSDWSDGGSPIDEMARAARDLG
ncbi:MAG: PHP domain-containing protein, partial [Acidimicrobiales bacterium]